MHAQARTLRIRKCCQNWKLNLIIWLPLITGIVVLVLWATKVIELSADDGPSSLQNGTMPSEHVSPC